MPPHDHSLQEQTDQLLRQARLRVTPGRQAIVMILLQARGPLTEQQILERLEGGELNKTTIYRALSGFIKAGIVHQAYIKDRSAYYELAHQCSHHQCHPHFTCTNCGRTECMTTTHLPLAEIDGPYKITRQKVELEGLCPHCQLHD